MVQTRGVLIPQLISATCLKNNNYQNSQLPVFPHLPPNTILFHRPSFFKRYLTMEQKKNVAQQMLPTLASIIASFPKNKCIMYTVYSSPNLPLIPKRHSHRSHTKPQMLQSKLVAGISLSPIIKSTVSKVLNYLAYATMSAQIMHYLTTSI